MQIHLEKFDHIVGHHCGSTSLSNLMYFDDTPMTEAMAFGLGSGLDFMYMHVPEVSPPYRFNGRCATLEDNFYANIERPISWIGQWSPQILIDALQENRPILCITDIYYLPYYRPRVHFEGHAIVVAGADDAAQTVEVADIFSSEYMTVSWEDLHNALNMTTNPLMPPFRWAAAPLVDPSIINERSIKIAIQRCVRNLQNPLSELSGFTSMDKMWTDMPKWKEGDGWAWTARFGYQVIEKRGTGGGAFRNLYGRFLAEAEPYLPQLKAIDASERAFQSAARWTQMAQALKTASIENNPLQIDIARDHFAQLIKAEKSLIADLHKTVGPLI